MLKLKKTLAVRVVNVPLDNIIALQKLLELSGYVFVHSGNIVNTTLFFLTFSHLLQLSHVLKSPQGHVRSRIS